MNSLLNRPLKRLPLLNLLAALLPLSLGLALAQQSFSLTPVILNVDPAKTLNASLTFTNTSTQVMTVNASVLEWAWKDNQEVNTPTRDLLLNPPSFTLKPGESQVIRVGLRRKPTPNELTYRLILAQQPPGVKPAQESSEGRLGDPTKPDSAPALDIQITQLFQARVAVYIAPSNTAPKLTFTALGSGAGLTLSVSNSGTRHQTLYDLTARRGGVTLPLPVNAVLQGAAVQYPLAELASLSGPLSLSYRTQDGVTVNETLPLP